ncbi:MAG: SufD family Fe-S cluster assembly protein [Planctomycetes bacterium]|nr:SufD family Fe-S cluster assembly protein [Planctomycetota bacterium]
MTLTLQESLSEAAKGLLSSVKAPEAKHELWRQVPIKRLRDLPLEAACLVEMPSLKEVQPTSKEEEVSEDLLVFQTGRLKENSSCAHVSIEAFSSVANTHEDILQQLSAQAKDDYYALNNLAHCPESYQLTIEPGRDPKRPIHLAFYNAHNNTTYQRIHIKVKSGVEAQLITSQHSLGEGGTVNMEVSVELEQGARLQYCDGQFSDAKLIRLGGLSVRQKRDSFFKYMQLSGQSLCLRQRLLVDLLEENAEVELIGCAYLAESSSLNHVLDINHHVPNCRSRQLFKNILSAEARSSFDGTIYVEKNAGGTSAAQLNNNLLLSSTARAHTKPRMKIYASDVECNHGATVGQLEEEEIFYLETRGLSQEVSMNLLAWGFMREVIDECPMEAFREQWAQDTLNAALSLKEIL